MIDQMNEIVISLKKIIWTYIVHFSTSSRISINSMTRLSILVIKWLSPLTPIVLDQCYTLKFCSLIQRQSYECNAFENDAIAMDTTKPLTCSFANDLPSKRTERFWLVVKFVQNTNVYFVCICDVLIFIFPPHTTKRHAVCKQCALSGCLCSARFWQQLSECAIDTISVIHHKRQYSLWTGNFVHFNILKYSLFDRLFKFIRFCEQVQNVDHRWKCHGRGKVEENLLFWLCLCPICCLFKGWSNSANFNRIERIT